jgi:ABC-type Fe3+-hydroxamate transport system substrate-binding protein
MFPPERIVCLTEETVETLYLLGEERRIVGISGYVVRPPRARREKPRVSAFTTADVPKILDLKPDLVLTFSDLQADIAATLIRHGIEVHGFNQRTVLEILDMILMLGALTGATDRAQRLAQELATSVAAYVNRPRDYPANRRWQVHGGTVQGIGQALLERAVYDSNSGQLVTASLMDYAVPRDRRSARHCLRDVQRSLPA